MGKGGQARTSAAMTTVERRHEADALALDEELRLAVTLIPGDSEHAARVRAAAGELGLELVEELPGSPAELERCVVVLDLTAPGAPAAGPSSLGPRVLAISEDHGLDCYDVVTPREIDRRLSRALRNLARHEQLAWRVRAEQETVHILNQIGYALSAQTNRQELLDTLLTHARQVLRADSGSIYLVAEDSLRFVCAQNDTVAFNFSEMELPLDETSLAGFVACRGEPLDVPDASRIPTDRPYRHNLSFDDATGYRTRSMLLVPLFDRSARVLGVLALMNRKPRAGEPIADYDQVQPFSKEHRQLARSIASQAAVAIENHRLYEEIRALFDGFVNAAVSAIEARDPSTGGHSYRVARLTTALAREVDQSSERAFDTIHYSEQELTELHYAAVLHDFGKVGVPEEVLLKAKRLFPWELEEVEARFRAAGMELVIAGLRAGRPESEMRQELERLSADMAAVRQFNEPGQWVGAEERAELERISRHWRLAELDRPLLSDAELERLCIPKGSLDPRERRVMEEHVSHTYRFLKLIPWTRDLQRVPELAYTHHEKLDGSGYPRRLCDQDIPFGAKLMAITDIFDALTAGDRPYKPRMPLDRALFILRDEAAHGRLVSEAVELFITRELWTLILE